MEKSNREYIANLDLKEIRNHNVIRCQSNEGIPAVLIRNSEKSSDTKQRKSDHLLLKTNVEIVVSNDELGSFHIILCTTKNEEIIAHFDNIARYLFLKKDAAMSSEEIVELFSSLVSVFKLSPEKNNLQMQIGVFGELISLHYFYNNNLKRIVSLWHKDFSSKHDIELDGKNRIEIKTTSSEKRIHRFGHNQICRKDVNVFILSLVTEPSEQGISLYELFQLTKNLVQDARVLIALELLEYKCGITDLEKGFTSGFDSSLKSVRVFLADKLPHLVFDEEKGVSNVSYDVDCQFAVDETAEVFASWQ